VTNNALDKLADELQVHAWSQILDDFFHATLVRLPQCALHARARTHVMVHPTPSATRV
jgi:hypothetical protein